MIIQQFMLYVIYVHHHIHFYSYTHASTHIYYINYTNHSTYTRRLGGQQQRLNQHDKQVQSEPCLSLEEKGIMQEIHKCTSEREKPAVGQQCRTDHSLYVRDGFTAVADWMSTDVCQHLCGMANMVNT